MATTIKVKRGNESTMPVLQNGELAVTLDTKKLFFGDGSTNHLVSKIDSLSNSYVPVLSSDGQLVNSPITVSGSDVNVAANIYPTSDNAYNLGSSSLRWKEVHAVDFYGSGAVNINGKLFVGYSSSLTTDDRMVVVGDGTNGITLHSGNIFVDYGSYTGGWGRGYIISNSDHSQKYGFFGEYNNDTFQYLMIGAYNGVANMLWESNGDVTVKGYLKLTKGIQTYPAVNENDAVPDYDSFKPYHISGSTTGGSDGYIWAQRWSSGGYVTQFYLDVNPTNIFSARMRAGDGTWHDWVRFYHSGNSNSTLVDWSAKKLNLNGTITGATSITTGTITPTNLLTGYLPYKSSGSLVDSPVYTDGTNVEIGDFSTAHSLSIGVNSSNVGIFGNSGSNTIFSLTRTNSPANADIALTAYNGIGFASGIAASTGTAIYYTDYKMYIAPTGFVGIGYTSDPTSGNKLAVNGNGYFNGNLTLNGTITGATSITASGNLLLGQTSNPGSYRLVVNGSAYVSSGISTSTLNATGQILSNDSMVIQTTGGDPVMQIDIGNGSFSGGSGIMVKLGDINEVVDGTRYEIDFDNGNHNFYGNVKSTGEVTAYVSSDVNLKTGITQIVGATSFLNQFNPVQFYWNDKAKKLNNAKDNRINYGLIAQDVKRVAPEFVHPVYGDYLSVDYLSFVPLLIKAEQEHDNEIERLKQRVTELETEVELLRLKA